MAESPTGAPEPNPSDRDNVRRIHHLVRMMQKYDLTAIDLVEGPTKIRLRRRDGEPSSTAPVAFPSGPPTVPATPPPVVPATSASPAAPEAPAASNSLFIESPMVGTLYHAGSPDSPPFVQVGSVIRPETTVCIIEAMKVFTEIPAGVSGTIAEVLVQDKQPVEFGQPLFRVEPA